MTRAIDAMRPADTFNVITFNGSVGSFWTDMQEADALCDRLLHNAHRISLKGASMRKTKKAPSSTREPRR